MKVPVWTDLKILKSREINAPEKWESYAEYFFEKTI